MVGRHESSILLYMFAEPTKYCIMSLQDVKCAESSGLRGAFVGCLFGPYGRLSALLAQSALIYLYLCAFGLW